MQSDDTDTRRVEQTRIESPFLTTTQAGTYVGLSRRTLEKMRTAGNGPAYRKHGRYVRYHIADLDAWSAARCKNSTPEYGDHPQSARHKRAAAKKDRPFSQQRKEVASRPGKGPRAHA
jgi:excisionase family DNA binding protein